VRRLTGLWVLLFSLFAATTALGQERTVRGTVVDSLTGEPVPNPTVQVEGTDIGVVGGEDGTFELEGVPGGEVTLSVQRIGFRTRTVTVSAGRQQIMVRLATDYLRVEELVVTGRATERERQNLATSVATVSGEEISRTSQQTLDKALQGRVTGAVISRNSGAPGGGVQVQLRGPSSINARSAPLYVVDGVIVSNEAIPTRGDVITGAHLGSNPSRDQTNQVNRIADLAPEDIASIEVLKGPAAAAIYGSKASNGVVIIETRKGETGAPRWRVTGRAGFYDLSNKIGSRVFEDAEEAASVIGPVGAEEWSANSEQFFDGGTPFFDHEEQLAGRNDVSWEGSASLSGGSPGGIRYYASALAKEDRGIIENTGFEKGSLRLNVDQSFGERANVSVNTNLLRSEARRGLTNNDNDLISYYMALSSTPSFVDLEQQADGSWPCNVAVGNCSNPLQTAAEVDNSEEVYRLVGSTSTNVNVVTRDRHTVTLQGTGGIDWFGQTNDIFSPPSLQYEPADGFLGTKVLSDVNSLQFNLNLNGVWEFRSSEGTSWTTSTGAQFEYSDLEIARSTGQNLTGGKDKVDAGTVIDVEQSREQVEDFGFYVQEELLTLDERLLLSGAVRFDQSSANADDEELFVYPHAAASYRFPDLGGVADELKVRAAFGVTGNRPLFGQEFTSLAVTRNIEGIPGFTIEGSVGGEGLKPERQSEIEGGFDLTAFGGRARLQVTGYRQSITDLILERQLAPSSGFETKFFNGGELRSWGGEVSLDATPVASRDLRWSAVVSFDLNRTEVDSLGVPSFVTGAFGPSLGAFRVEQGQPLTQIVGTDPRPEVAGADGLVRLGDANPDFSVTTSHDVRWKGFRFYQLWDWRQGFDVINLTELLYDGAVGAAVSPDWEDPDGTISSPVPIDDPDAFPLFDDGAGCFPDCSGNERLFALASGFARQYVQDASFLKLREATVEYELPDGAVRSLFGDVFESVRLSVSGRDLLTFTPYDGLDPEVSNFGRENFARNVDVAPSPPSRSFWFTTAVTF